MQDNTQAPEQDSTKDLVDWKNPPTLAQLKQNFTDAGVEQKNQVSKINTWLDHLHVRGEAIPKTAEGSSKIVPRLIRKQAEWRYAALSEPFLSTDDVFNVNPVTFEDAGAAQQNEILINYQFNRLLNKQSLIDDVVRTAVDEGTVIARLGWESKEEVVEEEVPLAEFTMDQSFAEELQKYILMQTESPSEFQLLDDVMKMAVELSVKSGMPMRPEIVGTEIIKTTKVVYNRPTVEICDYHNIIIDPTCKGNIKKAKFVIHSFDSNYEELKKDGKYKNLDKIQKDNNSILSQPDFVASQTSSFNFVDESRKKFVVHEYWGFWDINQDGVLVSVVIAWVGNTIIRMEENPFPDGELPFITCQYLPVRRSIYGEPDGALLIENQKVSGAVMRGMIDLLGKSANGQTGTRKDFLDATNQLRFDQGKDYKFNPQVDPRQAVYMHTFTEIPASAQYMLDTQQMEAESLSGVKAYNQGIASGSLGDVAAGIRGALDAASKRELGILRRISNFLCEIARKIIAMNAVFLSEQEVVRVTNEQFVTIDRNDLPGNFDLKVTVSTAEEDNNKANEISFMLQTMGNTVDIGIIKKLLARLFRLRKMPDIAHEIENYEPTPDPIQQELAQLEVERMRAMVADEIAQAQLRQAEAQLATAKIQTELAKARNIDADTDAINLDFVERESGVTQERDIQKQGAQADAQARMKMIEHGLKDQTDDKKFAQQLISNEQKAQHQSRLNNQKSRFVRV